MLRPATPLSVLLFVAFGLLLISVLSTPIIQAIPLGSFNNFNFGVFGYCDGSTCSKIEIGYDTSSLTDGDASDFDLPTSTRSTLSTILIVHPVAALVTLINLILALVSHLHSPSHSSRYLLAVFLISIIDLLLCLLAFLVDVLLFVPHMAFGSYFVLAATILVALGTLVSCAMRRTIVNRKARKKRIAENAEMSGENFYNRQNKDGPPPSTVQPTMPVVSGANGPANDKLPTFASYEKRDNTSDERIPLTARSPSERSPNVPVMDINNAEASYNGPVGPGPRRQPSRDQYGNPINPPPDAYGMRRPSAETQRPRGRGGMAPGGYRGRGGYGAPRGGGYGGPYGPGPGRGGYGPPARAGYGPAPGRGGYGPPARGYAGGMMRGGRPPPPPPSYNSGPYDRRGSPGPEYDPYGARQPSPGPPSAPGYQMNNMPSNRSMPNVAAGNSYEPYNPNREEDLPRAESPPPLPGTVMAAAPPGLNEMNVRNGTPEQGQQFRESDADIMGMVGLQQGRSETANRHDTYMSGSHYSQPDDAYVPIRTGWNQDAGRSSPAQSSPARGSPAHPSALPAPLRPGASPPGSAGSIQPPGETSYVEDIDPRFAEPPVVAPVSRPTPPAIETDHPYDSIPEGALSPAISEHSTFTSISQRGVNPRWPGNQLPAAPQYQGVPPRRPVQQPPLNNILLDNNPDFQLPGARGPSRGAGGYPTGF